MLTDSNNNNISDNSNGSNGNGSPTIYVWLQKLIDKPIFMKVIMYLIILNSVILGLKSYPHLMAEYGHILDVADDIMITIFVIELLLYLILYGPRKCFSDPWYIFDFIIISIAIVPAFGHFSALRAMRVLRILRLISIFPNLRKVIQGLMTAIPGIGSIGTILIITLYVAALMATNIFSTDFPELFGNLQLSTFSLFQIMTTEGWPDIARKVMKVYPYSWVFFITYILVATFIVVNLFIAVIVDAMQKEEDDAEEEIKLKFLGEITNKLDSLESKVNKVLDKK